MVSNTYTYADLQSARNAGFNLGRQSAKKNIGSLVGGIIALVLIGAGLFIALFF